MREILLIYVFCMVASCLTLQKNPIYSSKLSIQFDYAVTDKTCFYSAQIEVFWNEKQIMYAKPWDYDIHSANLKVDAVPGKNVLAFAGRGHSDGRGVAIANVRVLRDSSYGLQDLAWNGDFTETYEKKKGNYYKIFKKGIQGWKGKQIEVGYGQLYNYNWPVGTIVSELDANQNTQIQQTFYFWNNFEVFYEVDNKDLAA